MSNRQLSQPLSLQTVIRLLCLLLVLVTFVSGYYRARWMLSIKEYKLVEDRYVRVRQALGREKTQEIIDDSYKLE